MHLTHITQEGAFWHFPQKKWHILLECKTTPPCSVNQELNAKVSVCFVDFERWWFWCGGSFGRVKEDQWFTKDGNRCLGVAEEEKERCREVLNRLVFVLLWFSLYSVLFLSWIWLLTYDFCLFCPVVNLTFDLWFLFVLSSS